VPAPAVNKTDKEQRRRSISQALAASAPSVQQRTSDKSDTEHLKYLEVLEKLPDKKGVLSETT